MIGILLIREVTQGCYEPASHIVTGHLNVKKTIEFITKFLKVSNIEVQRKLILIPAVRKLLSF